MKQKREKLALTQHMLTEIFWNEVKVAKIRLERKVVIPDFVNKEIIYVYVVIILHR